MALPPAGRIEVVPRKKIGSPDFAVKELTITEIPGVPENNIVKRKS
jgi:hypothetical protein